MWAFTSANNKLAFRAKIDENYTFIVYNAADRELQTFDGFGRLGSVFRVGNTLYYSSTDEQNNAVLISDEGEILARVSPSEREDDVVRFRVSPGGDVYAHYSTPNGRRVLDLEGDMDNFERFSAFSLRGDNFYWVKRHINSSGIRGDWRWELYRNSESVSDVFYGFTELTLSDDGTRYAALVSDSPEYTVTHYNSVNRVMHERLKLFVDGEVLSGNFGAPVWCRQTETFKAIAQSGNTLIISRH